MNRYAFADFIYKLRFPSGWLSATDSRPHFDGHLLNVCTMIPSGLGEVDVEAVLSKRLRQSFRWMRVLRFLLRRGDKVQYCLGTINARRQFMKAWSSRADLSAGVPPRDVAGYWRPAKQSAA